MEVLTEAFIKVFHREKKRTSLIFTQFSLFRYFSSGKSSDGSTTMTYSPYPA